MRGGVGFGCSGAVGDGVEGSVVADRLVFNLGWGTDGVFWLVRGNGVILKLIARWCAAAVGFLVVIPSFGGSWGSGVFVVVS